MTGQALEELFGAPPDELPTPTATHWPSLSAEEAETELQDLRAWVRQLQGRFPHLDHHTIPACWAEHNEHIEALAALRDHERVSYHPHAPATAPVDWLRALRDITALLRTFTAEHACTPGHHQPVST